jgi:hypothetical protein
MKTFPRQSAAERSITPGLSAGQPVLNQDIAVHVAFWLAQKPGE